MKVEEVQLNSADKEIGAPNEPDRLRLEFKLVPNPEMAWMDLFEEKLKKINERSSAEEDGTVGKFSITGGDEELVEVYCHSVGEIEPLHGNLKNVVRRTNDEYPKFVRERETAKAKELAENEEIERLKKTLISKV